MFKKPCTYRQVSPWKINPKCLKDFTKEPSTANQKKNWIDPPEEFLNNLTFNLINRSFLLKKSLENLKKILGSKWKWRKVYSPILENPKIIFKRDIFEKQIRQIRQKTVENHLKEFSTSPTISGDSIWKKSKESTKSGVKISKKSQFQTKKKLIK